jgi:acetylornithine deacetylase
MELAQFVVEWLREQQVTAKIEQVQPGRPNVYAEVGDGDGPTLCLCDILTQLVPKG